MEFSKLRWRNCSVDGGPQKRVTEVVVAVIDVIEWVEDRRIDELLEAQGRTLADAFVILDEAQNVTGGQMKMFLTRLGFNSKAVITGDITQIDLPAGRRSGLVEALEVVGGIEGIGFIYFNERDVVRHNLVQQIIKAYDEFGGAEPRRPAASENGGTATGK